MNKELEEALASIEGEAKLAETHDIGAEGARRLHAAAALLRRFLLILATAIWIVYAFGCSQAPTPSSDLVAAPGVSAPVVERVRAELAAMPTPSPDEPRPAAQDALMAPPKSSRSALAATAPFDCRAFAESLLPWKGPIPDPTFTAIGAAMLPDLPEYAQVRAAACATLAARAGAK